MRPSAPSRTPLNKRARCTHASLSHFLTISLFVSLLALTVADSRRGQLCLFTSLLSLRLTALTAVSQARTALAAQLSQAQSNSSHSVQELNSKIQQLQASLAESDVKLVAAKREAESFAAEAADLKQTVEHEAARAASARDTSDLSPH